MLMSSPFAQHQSVLRRTKLVWAGSCHHESVLTQIQLICASTTCATPPHSLKVRGGWPHVRAEGLICPCHVLMSILLLDMVSATYLPGKCGWSGQVNITKITKS